MNPLKIISAAWMNRVSSYDQSYYTKNHLFYRRSLLLPFTKAYYRYLASYAMAGAVKLEKGAKVLDIGCGVGSLVEQFNHLDYDCVGVDVNPQAIKNSVYPQKCYLVDTSAKLKYQPGYFDLIVSREVLEHIPADEIDECIEEWDRVRKVKWFTLLLFPSAVQVPPTILFTSTFDQNNGG